MSATGIVVRAERPGDAPAIEAVTIAAFRDAPYADHTEHLVVDALRASGKLALSLVAEVNGAIVGHVALSPVTISDGTPGWFGLGPLSVAPSHQGRGIGMRLMEEALRALGARGANGCVVLGDPAYYSRFGFRPEAALLLADVPPQYFLALPFTEKLPNGMVLYDAAFSATA